MTDVNRPMRLPDWQAQLVVYLASIAPRDFEPGQHDCALAFAGAIEAMTGTDLAARFRGRYSSFNGGLKLLKKAGWNSATDYLAAHCPEVSNLAMAHAGDIALLDTPEGVAFGLYQGEAIYVLRPDHLGLRPRSDAQRAFHVLFAGEVA